MNNQFSRTENLIGGNNMQKLKNARVAVFGAGGVGSWAAEALVRAGIGAIDVIDSDTVAISNINRQIIATYSTLGHNKVDVCKTRCMEINPDIKFTGHCLFFDQSTADLFDFSVYDYIIDAIDTVTSKILLIIKAENENVPIISSMGTGNKLNPAMLEVADIYKTSVCPLARVMRHELRKRGIKNLKTVYSKEVPLKPQELNRENGKSVPASVPFVPAAAGLIIAAEVFKDIIYKE